MDTEEAQRHVMEALESIDDTLSKIEEQLGIADEGSDDLGGSN